MHCPIVCRGMIHISNIADGRINQVSDVFEVGEQVKVILVKSPVPGRLAFRYAALIYLMLWRGASSFKVSDTIWILTIRWIGSCLLLMQQNIWYIWFIVYKLCPRTADWSIDASLLNIMNVELWGGLCGLCSTALLESEPGLMLRDKEVWFFMIDFPVASMHRAVVTLTLV